MEDRESRIQNPFKPLRTWAGSPGASVPCWEFCPKNFGEGSAPVVHQQRIAQPATIRPRSLRHP
jgi:hypothetical protein